MNLTTQFLYESNLLYEILILLSFVISFFRQRYLPVVLIGVLLLRPNERFECFIPYGKFAIFFFLVILTGRIKDLKAFFQDKVEKSLLYFIYWIIFITVLFNRWHLLGYLIFIGTGLSLYLALVLFSDDKNSKLINQMVVLCCFLVCLEPLYYHLTAEPGSELWNLFHWDGRLQGWGMWANANETSFMACIGVGNALSLLSRNHRGLTLFFAALLIPFFVTVVVLTGSRAGMMSLALIFFPFLYLIRAFFIRILIVGVLVGTIVLSQHFAPERHDKQASTEERFDLRYEGIQLVKQHPFFGIGFGMFKEDMGGQPLHNTYVQAFAETGIIGGLLLLNYLRLVGSGIYGRYRQIAGNDPLRSRIACYAGIYLASIFYLFWGNQLLSIMFFLIIAQLKIAVKELAPVEPALDYCAETS